MKQTEDKPKEQIKEPALPVMVPLSVVRWFAYSAAFIILLRPFLYPQWWQNISGGLILGWFASQLNALINKK